MSLAGLVQPTDIARLDLAAFRRLINRLLSTEASIHSVPLGDLDLTLRENDPDGGVDARIKWPDLAPPDILFPGDNVLQYKTGNTTKAILKKELHKPGVQECLKAGGHYHILISQDIVGQKLDRLRKVLEELCNSEGFDPKRSQILAASHIARWVSHHPAVIICPELGKGLPAFSTVEDWSNVPSLQNPWKPDALRREVIERVETILKSAEVQDPVVRIEGPAGVGKTRLALECIKAATLQDRILYAPYAADTGAHQLATAIQSDPQAYAIIVADECDRDRQNIFKSYADLAGGRLRLICVGPEDPFFDSPADFGNVFIVSPMADTNMREVLTAALGIVPPFVTEVAVRLSGGYPKLAFFVATAIKSNSSTSPEEIRRIPSVRVFLKKFLPPGTLNALSALSLFQRLGWEQELRPEAETVASYLGIPFTELQDGVKALRDEGVVASQGRYLYVTPELLAISAAADLWGRRGSDLVRIIEKMPTSSSRRELLKRLASMGRHREVKKVVETLLGDAGLFQSLGDFEEEFRGEAFRILASSVPEAATRVLERIIQREPRGQLLDFKAGRRNVIWTIETLLRWPETSLSAARSLRSLALAENEAIGNNATAIFSQYFHIHLSGSPVPYLERLQLIDELTGAGEEASRSLAVSGLGAGLVSYETRMGGDFDELARRPYPREWRPKTWPELWEARRAALSRLEQIATGTDQAASDARKTVLGSIFTLEREGMFEDAIRTLENLKPETDDERRLLLNACVQLQQEAGERLSAAQKNQLERLRDQIFGTSYFARVRRWAGPRLHVDFDLEEEQGYARVDAITQSLAEEGFKNGISNDELTWLASTEAENVWLFGLRLGELDVDLLFFDRIVASSPEDINALLLAAYLVGHGKARGQKHREDLIDRLCETHPLKAFATTWRGEASHRGLDRIVSLVESGKVAREKIGFLMYGGWTKHLSADQNATLVKLMLKGHARDLLEPCMSFLHDALQREPDSINKLDELVWEVLEATPGGAPVMVTWWWGRLGTVVAARDPHRMVRLIIRRYSTRRFIPLPEEHRQALRVATEADPTAAWNMIGDAILSGKEASTGLLVVLRRWYGELIPVKHLISWAKANEPRGPWVVARLIVPDPRNPSSRARALVLAFRGNKDVWNQLYANTVNEVVWTGPYSTKIQKDLSTARQWAEDPDPEFQAFAKDVIKELEERLRIQKIREEEGEF